MNEWRKKFRKWARRSDFVEVHPQVFRTVLDDFAQLEATNTALLEALEKIVAVGTELVVLGRLHPDDVGEAYSRADRIAREALRKATE